MLASEAKLIAKSRQIGEDYSGAILSKILIGIESAALVGDPDMVVLTLSEEQIDHLQKMGYAIFHHEQFGKKTGNHVISWFCKPEESFTT